MDTQVAEYRKLFPVTEHYVYLNHAACAPMSQPGLDAIARYWEGQSTRGVLNEPDYFPVIDHAREKVARLLNVDECEIGWVQNTAMAINLVANGLDWQSGDNVVTVEGEFPANVYPWLGLKRYGVETRFVLKRGNMVHIDDIAAQMDERTRVLSISYVDFGTGVRNDVMALGQLCSERGVLFNVDAIQGVGALQLDVHAAGIHFLAAGAHKWLLGPQGVGIFYIRKDMLERLNPLTANWYNVVDRTQHLNYGQPWVDSAARVEGSTPNVSGIVAFDAVLKMIMDVGLPTIEERVLCLSKRMVEGLLSKGYDVVSSIEEGKSSGVVCFRAKGDPMEIYARAQAEKIVVAVRVGVVRVSAHFYNSEDEIDRLLDLL